MAKIFYGVAGEGRGHAMRARAIVEGIRSEHEIVIYAPAYAYELLASVYQGSEIAVRRIPGLCFQYNSRQRLAYWRTAWRGLRYLIRAPLLIRLLQEDIEAEQPKLVIADFEPALPRAAVRCGVPFISLSHQHFLVTCDLSSLPSHLRRHAAFMARVVRSYYSGQAETIVSSFYFPPLKPAYRHVAQVGVLLRPEILGASPDHGGHIVAYWRRFASRGLLNALEQCGHEVRVYGLGASRRQGSLRFFDTDVFRFVEDLATSRALISTAGNQLVGEALFLGKPVLAIPEPGNFEQGINAHFLQQSGAGMSVEMDRITPAHIRHFLHRVDDLRVKIDRKRLYGNPEALAIIKRHLEQPPLPQATAEPQPAREKALV